MEKKTYCQDEIEELDLKELKELKDHLWDEFVKVKSLLEYKEQWK